jgi:hypothetical protein
MIMNGNGTTSLLRMNRLKEKHALEDYPPSTFSLIHLSKMSISLPSELLRHVFLYARSPTAWIIYEEFSRRAKEQADEEAHEDAAERHYANLEYQNEMEASALYAADQDREEWD